MPLTLRRFIHRYDLRKNPTALFVFGDNMLRQGRGGQASQMRGEPNAIGLVTKRSYFHSPGAFFNNSDLELVKHTNRHFVRQLEDQLKAGELVIWPEHGIGTGFALLESKAPFILSYYEQMLKELQLLAESYPSDKKYI